MIFCPWIKEHFIKRAPWELACCTRGAEPCHSSWSSSSQLGSPGRAGLRLPGQSTSHSDSEGKHCTQQALNISYWATINSTRLAHLLTFHITTVKSSWNIISQSFKMALKTGYQKVVCALQVLMANYGLILGSQVKLRCHTEPYLESKNQLTWETLTLSKWIPISFSYSKYLFGACSTCTPSQASESIQQPLARDQDGIRQMWAWGRELGVQWSSVWETRQFSKILPQKGPGDGKGVARG